MATKIMQIGDKLVEVEMNKNGVPVVKARAEEIRHPDGRVDVNVYVPCLNLKSKSQEGDNG